MPCSTKLVAAWLSAPVKLVQKPFCAAPPPPPPDAGQLLGAQNLHASELHQPGWHTKISARLAYQDVDAGLHFQLGA